MSRLLPEVFSLSCHWMMRNKVSHLAGKSRDALTCPPVLTGWSYIPDTNEIVGAGAERF